MIYTVSYSNVYVYIFLPTFWTPNGIDNPAHAWNHAFKKTDVRLDLDNTRSMITQPSGKGETMGEDRLEQLMNQHGLKRTHAGLATVRFEKKELTVETRDSGETFIVKSGSTIHACPTLTHLADYLGTLPTVARAK